ncbi:hypothetical protein NO932_03840 [Pelagibacterium sp. 26DY04]|uniref:hypothetical protein n=1 Tax=Pelagibacterium sp. 26DY04 TaxID=2967130 RepID=UPI002814C06D|nr:hypothetical protein [Pelagibacterium sp. 26DY04]WMT87752.1 hypothetical protein NO932_03840 [Pelagibacterium sp. 26DY04]
MHVFPASLFTAFLVVLPLAAQEPDLPEAPEVVTQDPLVPESTLDEGEALPENPYYDDRSTAAAVVESLYNAINRSEYLRAWSYFDHDAALDEEALAQDFEAFAEGYRNTDNVQLLVGPEITEGAAGTVYYSIPVAIEATDRNGASETFAGCYTLKLAQPVLQATPPFRPLAIMEGNLEPSEGALETILPSQCTPA